MTPDAPLRVAALTRGRDVPSARFRVRQHIPLLERAGILVREHAPRRPAHRLIGRGQPGALLQAFATRGAAILATRRADVTWLQRELVSTRRTLEGWTKAPRVLDVDDAIHLKRDGAAGPGMARIARDCRMVLAGNRTLADWYRDWCEDVRIVPTTVDASRFSPGDPAGRGPSRRDGRVTLGWIGTAANAGNLQALQQPLADVLARHPQARLRVVAERPPTLPAIPVDRWEFIPWSEATEVESLRSFDVGLMPLDDTPWNRGKCGFKLLQYMAVGAASVASPVGVNADILAAGRVGLAASAPEEWKEALDRVLSDQALRTRMGAAGRSLVVERFSAEAVAPTLARAFRDAVR